MIANAPEHGTIDARSKRQLRSVNVASEAARRELVHRVAHSQTFGRSERLGTLLTYVCEMSFAGRVGELNEQNIGQAVFDRPPDYDSAVDGIVRSQASRLRQRLELYFQQEGAGEPVRIVIPRGGYVPLFEPQIASAPSQSGIEATAPVPETDRSLAAPIPNRHPVDPFHRRWLPWALSLVLGLMLVGLWVHDRQQPPVPVALRTHPLWSHLFRQNEPTMIVAPDSGLVLYHAMSGKDIDLKQYLEAGYRFESKGLPQIDPTTPQQDWLLNLANRRYTSIVDVDTILRIRDRARTLGSNVSVRYARDLRPDDFKRGNVVLLGAYTANPWIELFEPSLNFLLKDDYVSTFSVVNRSPQKGEPAAWVSSKNDPQRRTFGMIAYLPNLQGNGNALLIEGIGMSGAEAAADFVDDDTKLMPFLNQIRRPDGTTPHFELLIETSNLDASAVQSHILAWRASK